MFKSRARAPKRHAEALALCRRAPTPRSNFVAAILGVLTAVLASPKATTVPVIGCRAEALPVEDQFPMMPDGRARLRFLRSASRDEFRRSSRDGTPWGAREKPCFTPSYENLTRHLHLLSRTPTSRATAPRSKVRLARRTLCPHRETTSSNSRGRMPRRFLFRSDWSTHRRSFLGCQAR